MQRTRTLKLAGLAAPLILATCTGAPARPTLADDSMSAPASSEASSYGADVSRDLERVRAATKAFHDIAAAHAVGYPTSVPRCLQSPSAGAMGQHYVSRKLLDDQLDVEQPEILLYAPTKDGKQKLLGVEYIMPYSKWSRDKKPPRIFGQDLKPSDELSLWYLHVWVWEQNSAGLFADWNPAVKC